MSTELSKKDKRIARELIEKGLQKELAQAFLRWKAGQRDLYEYSKNR